jgi:carbon-monoxide dehydrogenase small subunit
MTIGFILNGEDVVIKVEPGERLITILREQFRLLGAKSGCRAGGCGACTVIFNGSTAPACLIPAFRLRGSEVVTIEGFAQNDEYADIVKGFEQASVRNCGFCDSGKILLAAALLGKNPSPTRDEVLRAFAGVKCRCTEHESLVNGILAAGDVRRRRQNAR